MATLPMADLLAVLPESVKRNILSRLKEAPNQAPVLSVGDSALLGRQLSHPLLPADVAQQVSGRHVLLPSLKSAGVVDNVLLQPEIKVVYSNQTPQAPAVLL
jgi:DNA-binding transcriptional regulator YdaS (Cro superfamily)